MSSNAPHGWFTAALMRFHYLVNVVTLCASTAIIGTDVVLRYVFNAPLSWSIEATSLLLLVMVFGSLPYVWERGGHVRMEIIYVQMRGVPRLIADFATALCGALFSTLLCYQMLLNVPLMWQRHEAAEFLGVPHWPFALFVACVAALMTLQFVAFAARSLVKQLD